jgi:hypothetical protein
MTEIWVKVYSRFMVVLLSGEILISVAISGPA